MIAIVNSLLAHIMNSSLEIKMNTWSTAWKVFKYF